MENLYSKYLTDVKLSEIQQYGQEHLLVNFQNASNPDKYAQEISNLDFKAINELYELTKEEKLEEKLELSPIPNPFTLSECSGQRRVELWNSGIDLISKNKLAVVIMGGGQGSRLGFEHPKGMFQPNLPSLKSLYEIFADRLRCLQKLSGSPKTIPLCIMTSETNNDETIDYFNKNSNFGLTKENIHFFAQGSLPALSIDGKILLASDSEITKAPNGNGAIYEALKKSGLLSMLANDGVDYFNLVSVDNLLSQVGDPIFIAFAKESNAKIVSKYLIRVGPEEKVGVHGIKNGKPTVIEYSELSSEESSERLPNGQLKFSQSNICNTLISVPFLQEILNNHDSYSLLLSRYHVAKKKTEFFDVTSKCLVKSETTNNCFKFELFYFNLFELADKIEILEVSREDEFAPIKNASGVDSPESAIKLYSQRNKRWLEKYNCAFKGNGIIDIDPSISYAGEGLECFKDKEYETPIYLH